MLDQDNTSLYILVIKKWARFEFLCVVPNMTPLI